MSFDHLLHASKLCHVVYPHNLLVFEWSEKRQHLAIYLQDLPRLIDEYKRTEKNLSKQNPMITLVDPIPRIRLSSACEAAANSLYGMAEIAAQFGNKVTSGFLPASFNALRKKVERGDYANEELTVWARDFGWYKKVRELRTEWAHFSTVFIGEGTNGEPVLVVRCHRRASDREEFRQQIHVQVTDLIDWMSRAISVVDSLGDYLLTQHIIPKFDPYAKVIMPRLDQDGWPIIKADHRFEVEEITVADYLAEGGIKLPRK